MDDATQALLPVTPVLDVKEEWRVFQSWWQRHRPGDPVPSPASLIFDAWTQSARHRQAHCLPGTALDAANCEHCDGTGDVHSIDGEWRGRCHCPAALTHSALSDLQRLGQEFDAATITPSVEMPFVEGGPLLDDGMCDDHGAFGCKECLAAFAAKHATHSALSGDAGEGRACPLDGDPCSNPSCSPGTCFPDSPGRNLPSHQGAGE